MTIQILRNIFIASIWLTPVESFAQLNTLQIPAPALKSTWGAKIEFSAKSTYDKENTLDGYNADADFQVYRMFSPQWGALLGSVITSENREGKPSLTQLELASLGVLNISYFGDLKWRTQLTYNYFLPPEVRDQKSSEGYILGDIRSYAPLGMWGRARLRLRHYDFLPFVENAGVLLRQTKIEYSPAALNGPLEMGLKNQHTHFWHVDKDLDTLELAPFIKYNGDMWEPLLKISYRPLEKSEDFEVASAWEQRPYYSVELEMNF